MYMYVCTLSFDTVLISRCCNFVEVCGLVEIIYMHVLAASSADDESSQIHDYSRCLYVFAFVCVITRAL